MDTLDQQKAVYTSSFEIIENCIDGLLQMADDGSVAYAIAKDEQVSEGGLTYTFKLREDAFWSNGDPVTAHDFVYGWQRAIDPATESEYAFMMSDIAQIKNARAVQVGLMNPDQLGVRAVDNYTLQVQLEVPVSYFDQLLYFCTFYPTNQKFVEKMGDKYGTSLETYLSNGAFMLSDYNQDAKTFKLIKNTSYYDTTKVKLAGLQYKVVDAEDALKQYRQGQLDLVELKGDVVSQVMNGREFKSIDSSFLYYIIPNLNVPEFQNENLRLALSITYNREEAVKNLGNGSKPAYQCIPSGFAFNSKGEDFVRSQTEYKDVCSYNPELAWEYFAKAKKELGKKSFSLKLK